MKHDSTRAIIYTESKQCDYLRPWDNISAPVFSFTYLPLQEVW